MKRIESAEESRKLLDKITFDLTRSIVNKDELTRFWFFILIMFVGVGLWGWGIQINEGRIARSVFGVIFVPPVPSPFISSLIYPFFFKSSIKSSIV